MMSTCGEVEDSVVFFFFQAEDGIGDYKVTGVQTCALPICPGTPSSYPAGGARGGLESVTDANPPRAPPAVYELGVPVLGICYGMQTMAQQLGGRVTPGVGREVRYARSEERRVGEESRSRGSPYSLKKKLALLECVAF